jgi:DNA-binding transcriptional ArsR family regulator
MSETLVDSCAHLHADPTRVADVRDALPDEPTVAALADTFKALGDPTRVRLLIALSRAELCV